jgi:hypothetical protein
MKKTISSSSSLTIHILVLLSTFIVVFLFCYEIGNSGNSNVMGQSFDKAIFFPQVNVTDNNNNNNNQNNSLDEEFIVVNTNATNNFQIPIEVANPDFWLTTPFAKLVEGQKYTVNSPNDEDIKYNNISVKLAPILSVSSDIQNLTDADPENPNDMTLGKPIDIGHYGAVDVRGGGVKESNSSSSSFIMPTNLKSGNYILYVYLQYPYGITGVFSNAATVTGLDKK